MRIAWPRVRIRSVVASDRVGALKILQICIRAGWVWVWARGSHSQESVSQRSKSQQGRPKVPATYTPQRACLDDFKLRGWAAGTYGEQLAAASAGAQLGSVYSLYAVQIP